MFDILRHDGSLLIAVSRLQIFLVFTRPYSVNLRVQMTWGELHFIALFVFRFIRHNLRKG